MVKAEDVETSLVLLGTFGRGFDLRGLFGEGPIIYEYGSASRIPENYHTTGLLGYSKSGNTAWGDSEAMLSERAYTNAFKSFISNFEGALGD